MSLKWPWYPRANTDLLWTAKCLICRIVVQNCHASPNKWWRWNRNQVHRVQNSKQLILSMVILCLSDSRACLLWDIPNLVSYQITPLWNMKLISKHPSINCLKWYSVMDLVNQWTFQEWALWNKAVATRLCIINILTLANSDSWLRIIWLGSSSIRLSSVRKMPIQNFSTEIKSKKRMKTQHHFLSSLTLGPWWKKTRFWQILGDSVTRFPSLERRIPVIFTASQKFFSLDSHKSRTKWWWWKVEGVISPLLQVRILEAVPNM